MRFNPMRTGRYQPGQARFPTMVYPKVSGLVVQAVIPSGAESVTITSESGEVSNVSYIAAQLLRIGEDIIGEDSTPHFEEVDWKSGVVIEGVLSAESFSTMDDLRGDLVGDFGDVADVHFIGLFAYPYKFWRTGRDRYDVGMRRATLMRAMGRLGMLAYHNESCCWLMPRFAAKNEYQMMSLCDRMSGGDSPITLQSDLSFKLFPKFSLENGMIYDFTLPWAGDGRQLQVPTKDQIEDGLL